MSYSKHNDINAVLEKAEKDISAVEKRYADCLNEQTIPDDMLVEVKDCISNIRTALDYAWCKVPNAGTNSHFPISNSPADFANKVQNIDQKYIAVVEPLQSYNGDPWLENFGRIRNKNEHLTLIPQVRKETNEFSIRSKQGGSIVARGCTFRGAISFRVGGVNIPIDEATQFPAEVESDEVEIERKVWVDFLFDGSSISPDFPQGVSALPFLKQSLASAASIVQALEK